MYRRIWLGTLDQISFPVFNKKEAWKRVVITSIKRIIIHVAIPQRGTGQVYIYAIIAEEFSQFRPSLAVFLDSLVLEP